MDALQTLEHGGSTNIEATEPGQNLPALSLDAEVRSTAGTSKGQPDIRLRYFQDEEAQSPETSSTETTEVKSIIAQDDEKETDEREKK